MHKIINKQLKIIILIVTLISNFNLNYYLIFFHPIYPLASPSTGAAALKYGDVNTVTPSPGEVKGLIVNYLILIYITLIFLFNHNSYLSLS